jgi:ABC-type phosphate transport system substrate-binding protein
LRIRRTLLAGFTAGATVAGVLGLAASAQAQTAAPKVAATIAESVPAGVVTGVTLNCPSGAKFSSFTSAPKQPSTVTDIALGTGLRLAGVWGKSGSPPKPVGPFTVKVKCTGGKTATYKLTNESAPTPTDITGVGSDTIQNVMDQFSADFNAKLPVTAPHLYSWDATNPVTGAIADDITIKTGGSPAKGTCQQPRPDGSSAGITALTTTNPTTSGHPCIDFARSSRDRAPTDPPYAKNGIAFTTLAGDAVTYATQPSASGKPSNAPTNLTTAQLTSIYTCKVTNWSQVGGKSAPIKAFIPQSTSGTRAFFLAALGLTNPGTCVSDLPTKALPGGSLEENEGTNPVFKKSPQDVIFPYSVGKYIAQRFHSAKCSPSTCLPAAHCHPNAHQNLFGCDEHGAMQLNKINGTAPTKPFPLTNSSKHPVINPGYTPTFSRLLFEVVPFSTATGNVNHIPPYLAPLFGPKGFTCTNATAKKDLLSYGFRVLPTSTSNKAGTCGSTH